MQSPLFTGVCTALVTPFTANGVNYPVLDKLLEGQISCGISAVCVCGTTGEAAAMSDDEILQTIAHTVRFCQERIKVIAGTGSNSTKHACVLTAAASAMGADAVLVVTPYYNKATAAGLVEHYTAVADASACPVIIYNVPARTGVDIPIEVYEILSRHPNICGVKEASGDLHKQARIRAACGDSFTVWCGSDEIAVASMALGAAGIVSVLSGICPEQANAMINACRCGDYAAASKMQCKYIHLIDALFREVNPIPIKAALEMTGISAGRTRLPLCAISEEAETQLKSAMAELKLI